MNDKELVLKASRKKTLMMLAGCVLFAIIGYAMAASGQAFGWLALGFGVIGIPVFVMQLQGKANYLKLTPQGFEIKMIGRSQPIVQWQDVEGFFVYSVSGARMVGFNYSENYHKQAVGRSVAKSMAGVEGALPNTYDISPDDLAQLLNQWRLQYGGVTAPTPSLS